MIIIEIKICVNKRKTAHNKNMKILLNIFWGIPIGFINGFFGSGGGVCAVYILKKFLKVEDKKAHATAIGIILPLSCASLFMYSKGGFDLKTIFLCSSGGAIGGFLGAKFLSKIPKKWLKIAFGGVMILAGGRMVI